VTAPSAGSTAAAVGGDRVDGDRIQLRGIRVTAIHGVLPEERVRPQPFEVDLDLWVDLATAGASDQLDDTVDYADIADVAIGVVSGSPSYQLLEAVAASIAAATLARDRRIAAVTVGLRKLEPPLDVDIATVGVCITRRQ
jgi:dihydroneopterin aldolase